jgi:cell division protein ZapA (FtsZ GTPase activity inhibitor)
MSAELITINVWLGGRSYRISIKPEEEEAVRKAVKLAEEKVIELRHKFAGKDDQDFLAMCLLMYASDNATEPFHHPVLQSDLKEMSDKIDEALNAE